MKFKKISVKIVFIIFMITFLLGGCSIVKNEDEEKTQEPIESIEASIDDINDTEQEQIKIDEDLDSEFEAEKTPTDSSVSATDMPQEVLDNSFDVCAKSYYDRCYINNPKPANQQRCLDAMKRTIELNCPDILYGTKK